MISNILNHLLEGEQVSRIEYTVADKVHNSIKTEVFTTMALTLTKCNSIDEELEEHIRVETLEEAFESDEHGLVTGATRRLVLVKLPKVLLFDLKRITSNLQKNNKRFEFAKTLDMSRYVESNAALNQCYKYQLFAVGSHCGEASEGHYTAFIRPNVLQDFEK